jgi:hypothetical protein
MNWRSSHIAVAGTRRVAPARVTNTVHHFESTDDLVKEEQVARINGGMHFRTSTVDGKVLGMKVAKWVTKNYFQPVDHEDHEDHDE